MTLSWKFKLANFLVIKLKVSKILMKLYPIAVESNFRELSREKIDIFRDSLSLEIDPSSKLFRLGDQADGGYLLSRDIGRRDLCLSFGIGTNYSFDLAMAELCKEVWMFDHTIEEPVDLRQNMKFFKKGLSNKSHENFVTLEEIFHRIPDSTEVILKIDIEGDEWDVLHDVETCYLDKCKQIVLELHGIHNMVSEYQFKKVINSLKKLSISHSLRNIHVNNWAKFELVNGIPLPDVIEVTYLRKKSDDKGLYKSISLLSEENKPCNGNKHEIDLNFISKLSIKTHSQ